MTAGSQLLLEDHHVHSTFSDGRSTLEENIAQAETLGLRRLGCVDHVRADTTYVSSYVDAIRALRSTTSVELSIGIEAKILDTDGRLDLPVKAMDGVDRVYVADHQFPWSGGPQAPRTVKAWLESGEVEARACAESLVEATIAALRGHRRHQLVVAHLFSLLPKVGLAEDVVPDALLDKLAAAAADTGTIVEISERWRCPSIRTLQSMRSAGVSVVCSTDSHAAATIGRYDYVRATCLDLDA
jgi:putative hydrolase